MNAAERRRLLGQSVIDDIRERVQATPKLLPEDLDALRPILTRPAARRVDLRPADAA